MADNYTFCSFVCSVRGQLMQYFWLVDDLYWVNTRILVQSCSVGILIKFSFDSTLHF